MAQRPQGISRPLAAWNWNQQLVFGVVDVSVSSWRALTGQARGLATPCLPRLSTRTGPGERAPNIAEQGMSRGLPHRSFGHKCSATVSRFRRPELERHERAVSSSSTRIRPPQRPACRVRLMTELYCPIRSGTSLHCQAGCLPRCRSVDHCRRWGAQSSQ